MESSLAVWMFSGVIPAYMAVGEDGGVLSGNRGLGGVLYLLYGGSMGSYLDAGDFAMGSYLKVGTPARRGLALTIAEGGSVGSDLAAEGAQ